jgi:hypothetical protein
MPTGTRTGNEVLMAGWGTSLQAGMEESSMGGTVNILRRSIV